MAERSLGFSLLDVDQWMATQNPPVEISAIRGTFDPDSIAANLDACSECRAADVEEHRGWQIYAWGDESTVDLSSAFQPPLYDHLGRGGRLAVSSQLIARAHDTDTARAMVDAHEGDGSLADIESFRLAVAAVEEMGALMLVVLEDSLSMDEVEQFPEEMASTWEVQPGDTVLVPYEVVALADAWDGGPFSALVLIHETEEQAEENGRRFANRVASTRAPEDLAERIDGLEITVDGRTLRARIDGNEISMFDLLHSSLLLHE